MGGGSRKSKPTKCDRIKSLGSKLVSQDEKDLPDLLNEIGFRPWLLESQAFWDDSTGKLVIIAGYEFEERVEEGAHDEILDCVIATMHFDEKIEFDIERI